MYFTQFVHAYASNMLVCRTFFGGQMQQYAKQQYCISLHWLSCPCFRHIDICRVVVNMSTKNIVNGDVFFNSITCSFQSISGICSDSRCQNLVHTAVAAMQFSQYFKAIIYLCKNKPRFGTSFPVRTATTCVESSCYFNLPCITYKNKAAQVEADLFLVPLDWHVKCAWKHLPVRVEFFLRNENTMLLLGWINMVESRPGISETHLFVERFG